MKVAWFASHRSFAPIFLRPKGSWETSRTLEALCGSSRLESLAGDLLPRTRKLRLGVRKVVKVKKAQEPHGQENSVRSWTAWVPVLALTLTICMALTKSIYFTVPPFSHL